MKTVFTKLFNFKKREEFNIESHLLTEGYRYLKATESDILMRDYEGDFIISLNYGNNCLCLSYKEILLMKVNFIPNSALLLDMMLYNSINNFRKQVKNN